MSRTQVSLFIEQAAELLRQGRPEEGLSTIERALALDPQDGEALELKAIALATLDRDSEAGEYFLAATKAAPNIAKYFYNYAVYLDERGEPALALEAIRQAVKLDSSNLGSIDLMRRMETTSGAAPMDLPELALVEDTDDGNRPREQDHLTSHISDISEISDIYKPEFMHGFYGQGMEIHSLRWVEELGKTWRLIGWCLSALGILSTVFLVLTYIGMLGRSFSIAAANPIAGLGFSSAQVVFMTISLLDTAFLIVYMVFELLDRRKSWFWLVCCCLACCIYQVSWLIVGIYMVTDGAPPQPPRLRL
jgi:tetratricopeptide (TPR) repeat protein